MKTAEIIEKLNSILEEYKINVNDSDSITESLEELISDIFTSPVSVSDEEKAIGFAEWLYKKRWFHFENGFWYYTHEMGSVVSNKERDKHYKKTTSELYSLYIKETNKP